MSVYKNPNILILPNDDNFWTVVNPYIHDGLKVINSSQLDFLNKVDNKKDIRQLANDCNLNISEANELIKSFENKRIISNKDSFVSEIRSNLQPKTLNLWVHTTDKCNQRCNYCYISTIQSSNGMTEDTINQLETKLLQTVRELDLKSIKLRLSGGEPLLQFNKWKKFIIRLRKKLSTNNCLFSVVFLTNLTILNDEIISFAKKYNINFGVSLDGFGKYHDFNRKFIDKSGTFETVKNNINKLIDNGIIPSISTVVSQDNMDGLPILTKYLINLNVHFRYSIVHGEYLDRDKLSNILSECYNIMEKAIYLKKFEFTKKHKLCDLKPLSIFFQTCSSGHSGAAIYVDGGIYFCHVKFGGNSLIGSIYNEDNLLKIIQGKYSDFIEDLVECKECLYKYVCTGGCPVYRENGKDLSCEIYKRFIPRIYELIGKERLLKIKRLV